MFIFPPLSRSLRPLALAVVIGLGGLGCQPTVTDDQATGPMVEPLDITVSIPPQQYFLERLGGDLVRVSVLVPGNSDPHTYEPRPQQITALSQAQAYVLVGLGFEQPWLEKVKAANSTMKLIDSAQGITPLEMAEHDHDHDHHHHHSEQNTGELIIADPHIWLSPTLVKQQAANITEGLVALDPDNEDQYRANLATFLGELGELDGQLRSILAPLPQRKFIVYHPSWGYFAQDYDLEQIAIEVDGQEPSAQQLKQVVDLAAQENINTIFAEAQFNLKSPEVVAREMGGTVVVLDPLAPNWSENLLTVAQKIANANSAPVPN